MTTTADGRDLQTIEAEDILRSSVFTH